MKISSQWGCGGQEVENQGLPSQAFYPKCLPACRQAGNSIVTIFNLQGAHKFPAIPFFVSENPKLKNGFPWPGCVEPWKDRMGNFVCQAECRWLANRIDGNCVKFVFATCFSAYCYPCLPAGRHPHSEEVFGIKIHPASSPPPGWSCLSGVNLYSKDQSHTKFSKHLNHLFSFHPLLESSRFWIRFCDLIFGNKS